MSRKNKTIRIIKHTAEIRLFGILSQRLPHELIFSLNSIWRITFKKFSTGKIEGFMAEEDQTRILLIANNLFSDINVDYLLVIIGNQFVNMNSQLLDDLKKNDIILGFYDLNLSKKQLMFLLQQLDV